MVKNEKIKRFSASILVVLSLFASSLAACCCDHHQEKQETEIPVCHSQAHETEAENAVTADNSFNARCGCLMESVPKVFAKSDNVKTEKQTAECADLVLNEITFALLPVEPENAEFSTFVYFSDSFYKIKSPRAPPRS